MSGELWIVVPRWKDYQHRDSARSKVPPWIKNETKLLSSPDYLSLTPHRRAMLHALWLEYARSLRRLPDDTATLSRRLGLRVLRTDLEALNHAGFIEFSASRPASRPASLDGEGDREISTKTPSKAPNGALFALQTLITNGAIRDNIDLDAEIHGAGLTLNDLERQQLVAMLRSDGEAAA